MRKRALQLGTLLFLITAIFLQQWEVGHSQVRERYFPSTGHYVTGAFLEAYLATPNYDLFLSAPITEVFLDPNTGNEIQFFENGILERKEEGVVRVIVGRYFSKQVDQPMPVILQGPCRTIGKYPVCEGFLEFFEQQGQVSGSGNPLGGVREEDGGLRVQDFEYARYEWIPSNSGSGYVRLAPLGRMAFYFLEYDEYLLLPVNRDMSIMEGQVLPGDQLLVYAFPARPSVTWGEDLELFVVVRGQNSLPQPGRDVVVSVKYPGETRISKLASPELTNSAGYTRIIIPTQQLSNQVIGLVEIQVQVDPAQNGPITRASFRISP